MIAADTDVLVDALHGKSPGVDRVREALEKGTLATSITVFELLSGAKRPKQREAVEALLAGLEIIPFSHAPSIRAAEIRRELEGEGSTIGRADYLIAGICVHGDLALLTRNRKHFERIRSLALRP